MKYIFPTYPKNWKTISERCRKRDGYRCSRCGRKGTFNNRLNAHHIISKSKGGSDSLFNLITLCKECHKLRHPHMKKRRGKRNG